MSGIKKFTVNGTDASIAMASDSTAGFMSSEQYSFIEGIRGTGEGGGAIDASIIKYDNKTTGMDPVFDSSTMESVGWTSGQPVTVDTAIDVLAKKQADLETDLSGLMFDVSEANGGEPFDTLSDALAYADSVLLASQKKGGMTIKYVQNSDNKYVQYRLMTTVWSSNVSNWTSSVSILTQYNSELDISDTNRNVITRFSNGHIKTKNFDSSNIKEDNLNNELKEKIINNISIAETDKFDLTLSDENGNAIVGFSNGHIKTKNFDSSKKYCCDISSRFVFQQNVAIIADPTNPSYGSSFSSVNFKSCDYTDISDLQGLELTISCVHRQNKSIVGLCFYKTKDEKTVCGSYIFNKKDKDKLSLEKILVPNDAVYVRTSIYADELINGGPFAAFTFSYVDNSIWEVGADIVKIGTQMGCEPDKKYVINREWDYEEFLANTYDKWPEVTKKKIGDTPNDAVAYQKAVNSTWQSVVNFTAEYPMLTVSFKKSDDSDMDDTDIAEKLNLRLKRNNEIIKTFTDDDIENGTYRNGYKVENAARKRLKEYLEITDGNYTIECSSNYKLALHFVTKCASYELFTYEYKPYHYKKTALLIANIHGGERESSYALARSIDLILHSPNNDKLKYLKDNIRMLIVPVMNPYGFNNDVEKWDGPERSSASNPTRVFQANANGLNLNRNWDFGWGNYAINHGSGVDDYLGCKPNQDECGLVFDNIIIPNYDEISWVFDCHLGTFHDKRYWVSCSIEEQCNQMGRSSCLRMQYMAEQHKTINEILNSTDVGATTAQFSTHVVCVPGYTLENQSAPIDGHANLYIYSPESMTNYVEYIINMMYLHALSKYNPRKNRSVGSVFRSRLLPSAASYYFGNMFGDSSDDIIERFDKVYSEYQPVEKITTEEITDYILNKAEHYEGDIVILGGLLFRPTEMTVLNNVDEHGSVDSNITITKTFPLGTKHMYAMLHLLSDLAKDNVEEGYLISLMDKYKIHFIPLLNKESFDLLDTNSALNKSSLMSTLNSYISTLNIRKLLYFDEVNGEDAILKVSKNTDETLDDLVGLSKLERIKSISFDSEIPSNFSNISKVYGITMPYMLYRTTGFNGGKVIEYTNDQTTIYASIIINLIKSI